MYSYSHVYVRTYCKYRYVGMNWHIHSAKQMTRLEPTFLAFKNHEIVERYSQQCWIQHWCYKTSPIKFAPFPVIKVVRWIFYCTGFAWSHQRCAFLFTAGQTWHCYTPIFAIKQCWRGNQKKRCFLNENTWIVASDCDVMESFDARWHI